MAVLNSLHLQCPVSLRVYLTLYYIYYKYYKYAYTDAVNAHYFCLFHVVNLFNVTYLT